MSQVHGATTQATHHTPRRRAQLPQLPPTYSNHARQRTTHPLGQGRLEQVYVPIH